MENVIMLEGNQIAARLPHEYPMLLVDRILEIEEGVRGVGIKNVTIDESYFEGHFPGEPVMPGTLIIECMAQTAAVVFGYKRGGGPNTGSSKTPRYLALIQSMRFRKKVIPGDQLIIEVRILKQFGPMIKVFGEAHVSGEVVASGTLTFAS
jgi:3-hydroxyacyl-[acyl-carrier-protein] dehydratase